MMFGEWAISTAQLVWGIAGFVLLYRPLRWLALRFGLVARSDFRRKNPWQVPLMGGVGIFLPLALGSAYFRLDETFTWLLCCGLIIVTGVIDDKFELRARPRLLFQTSIVALWLTLQPAGSLTLDFNGEWLFVSRVLCGFWIIGCINAMNMIDGMDRLAGGVGMICALAIAALSQDTATQGSMLLLAGGCAGFLIFNRGGRIYLGESGSTLLGFTLATTGAHLNSTGTLAGNIWAPLMILSYPCMDACFSMGRRLLKGESMFAGDRDHFHHKLKNIGLSTRAVTGVVHWICCYSAFAAWAIVASPGIETQIVLLAAMGMVSILGALLVFERLLARRIGQYSKTLIEKHLPISGRDLDPRDGDFSFLAVDLLPYYKDLQRLGLVRVEQFISELSDVIKKNCGNSSLYLAGAYTILIVVDGETQPQWTKAFIEDFKTLVARSKVTLSLGEIPIGIEYFPRRTKRATKKAA